MLNETYGKLNLPARYEISKQDTSSKSRFGKAVVPSFMNHDLNQLFEHSDIEDMLCKSEWLWNQYSEKGREKQTEEEGTYSVACLIMVVKALIVRKDKGDTPQIVANEKVIITKTGKVIKLSDETSDKPATGNNAEPTVIECIHNIEKNLRQQDPEHVKYVKGYIGDWVYLLMNNKFDKDALLSLYDAEEIRTKTLELIKKLNYDMVSL